MACYWESQDTSYIARRHRRRYFSPSYSLADPSIPSIYRDRLRGSFIMSSPALRSPVQPTTSTGRQYTSPLSPLSTPCLPCLPCPLSRPDYGEVPCVGWVDAVRRSASLTVYLFIIDLPRTSLLFKWLRKKKVGSGPYSNVIPRTYEEVPPISSLTKGTSVSRQIHEPVAPLRAGLQWATRNLPPILT